MIRKLLYLNGIAILGAVLNHATGWGFTAMFWWTDRYQNVAVPDFTQIGSTAYWGLRLIEQSIIFSVPAFIFVSGFFISFAVGHSNNGLGWQVVYERIRKLVIPYLIWSTIIIGLRAIQGQVYTVQVIFEGIIFGLTEPPYYFVPVLIQLYLLSPIIVLIARKKPLLLFLVAIGITFFVSALRYFAILGIPPGSFNFILLLTKSWLFPGFSLWFISGMLFGFNMSKVKEWLVRLRWIALAGMVIFFVAGLFEWEYLLQISEQSWIGTRETLIDTLFAVAVIWSYLGFEHFSPPFSAQFAKLGERSYGIYLTHSPVLEYTSRSIYHLFPALLGNQAFFQPVLLAAGLGIPLLMMAIIDRSQQLRKYYIYFFG